MAISPIQDFPDDPVVKSPSTIQATQDPSIPASERLPGGGNGNPLYYSCLKSPMGRGAWQSTVHGVWSCKELDMIE